VFIGASSPNECNAVVTMEAASGRVEVIRRSNEAASEPALRAYFSQPEPIEFPSSGGLIAHGLFYPPANPDYWAPRGEKPPLLVKSHGGPTAPALSMLDLLIQFWTSRGEWPCA
jgi:dipeptidyl aminopeptidase/acylaminoacyl peptidase